ncbi:MAG: helix-turn-helix transcriptional regulator [Saprospiraceae bacterium]|nr:helix-turn-helix transcriptional regulator [Saprospiraceae bacterium]
MTNFAKILRAVRKHHRLTQEQAAETFDIPLWTLQRVEANKRELTYPELERIARCCGTSVGEILQLENEEASLPRATVSSKREEHFEKIIAAQNEKITFLLEEVKNLYGIVKRLISAGGGAKCGLQIPCALHSRSWI